jgi:hypothetical protein
MKNIAQFLQHRGVYHSFFWFIYALIMLLLNENHEQWRYSITNVFIHTCFVALLVYYNFYYLIPNFLSRKRFFLYAFWLAFATLLVTPLELILLYWNLTGRENAQLNLIENQGSHYLVLLLVVSFSSVLRIIKYWFVQERVQRDLERRNLQSELSFLKSQINPHFLFNTLNSLYALTLKKSDEAPEVVLRLSEMMRYMLYECNEKYVSLQSELQYIKNYLALERVRYGAKAQIEFDCIIDKEDDYQVAPLLFITFLENSFKHGLSHRITAGFVTVYLQVENGQLEFYVDNSKADKKDESYYQGGIGLKNVRRRLELLYPDAYQLDIDEDETTYSVHLNLQLI